jgi:hypothetical protein
MIPYVVSSGWKSPKLPFRMFGEFLAGRLSAYLIFATLAALFGAEIQSSPAGRKAAAALMAGLAVLLILQGLSLSFPEWRACGAMRRSAVLRRFPFAAGLVLGINLCPPLVAALTYMLAVGRWLPCVGFSIAFFLGTVVFLLPLVLSGFLGRIASIRGLAEAAAVFSGIWFLAQAVSLWLRV